MRLRRLAAFAATACLAGLLPAQPAAAATRLLAYGHIVIQSDPVTGLPTFSVTDTYLTSFDCDFEQGALGTDKVVVLCTPKATIVDTVFFCSHWITTATASGNPTTGGAGEVRGTAQCKDAGGDAVTNLVTSNSNPPSSTVHGFPDVNVDVWAVRCYATGTGVNGSPTPGYYVDCFEPDIRLVDLR